MAMDTTALRDDLRDETMREGMGDMREGKLARAIEKRTAKLPSDTFLWGALGSIGISAILQAIGRKQESQFVGQWAPTLLILGLYNKIVKVAGSDRMDRDL